MTTTTPGGTGYTRRNNAGDSIVSGFAGALAVLNAAIHFILTPEHFHMATWLGIAFLVGGVALVVSALALFARQSTWAWWLGAAVMAGMFIGGILSRTTGLFGVYESAWEVTLLVCLALEAVYLMLFATSGFGVKRG